MVRGMMMMMKGGFGLRLVVAAALVMISSVTVSHGGGRLVVEAQSSVVHQHHVIGGDRGWDPSTDVASWSSGKVFRVGDNIWFAYSAAQEIVAELKNKEEFEACDVSNPIKMYTDGLNRVTLDREGYRYFASGTPENCKNGLKLHVHVLPQEQHHQQQIKSKNPSTATVMAAAPASPSATSELPSQMSTLFWIGLAFHLYCLAF